MCASMCVCERACAYAWPCSSSGAIYSAVPQKVSVCVYIKTEIKKILLKFKSKLK